MSVVQSYLVSVERPVIVPRPPVATGYHQMPLDLVGLHQSRTLKVTNRLFANLQYTNVITNTGRYLCAKYNKSTYFVTANKLVVVQ